MSMEPVIVELEDPIPGGVRLPGISGAIEACVTAVEIRPCGDMWVKLQIPTWKRWRTQLQVGQPSVEGIGPGHTEIWAPSAAVAIDTDRGPEMAATLQAARRARG